jgi:hypothetical protein
MAFMMYLKACSWLAKLGAKPPSSPTEVARPSLCRIFFRVWKVSAPMRRASRKLSAPRGMIMNSWMSRLLAAWAPPLMMFIMGAGRTLALMPPMYRYRGRPRNSAAALAVAMDTPSMALAPRRDLFSVPSRSMRAWSTSTWRVASRPTISEAISSMTLRTACSTPLPW